MGKHGILWKLDRKTGRYLGHKETVFQNYFDSFDAVTGEPHYRNDIVEQLVGQWLPGCPSTEGGKNWQAMSYNPPTNRLIIPLSQSCMEYQSQKIDQVAGGGGGGAGRRFFEMPGVNGNIGKLAAYASGPCKRYGKRATRRYWRRFIGGGRPFVGDLDVSSKRRCRATGRYSKGAAGDLGARIPFSFSTGGTVYCRDTGLGGRPAPSS